MLQPGECCLGWFAGIDLLALTTKPRLQLFLCLPVHPTIDNGIRLPDARAPSTEAFLLSDIAIEHSYTQLQHIVRSHSEE